MARSPCRGNNGTKKGPWSEEEDKLLIEYVKKHGHGNWQALPKRAGLNRCGKSCRLRWTNYLRPDIKRGGFSDEEEAAIISLHKDLGNKWSTIAALLPGRTDNEIKNFWNTHLRKKLLRLGIDPKTHEPIPNLNLLNLSQLLPISCKSNLINPMEPALRLQENAIEVAKIQLLQNMFQMINSNPILATQEISHLIDPIQSSRLINGINQHSPNNFFQPQNIIADLSNIIPQLNDYPSVTDSIQCLDDEFSPGIVDNNIKSFSTMHNSEYSLPPLVSVTTESSIVNPLERANQSCIPTQALQSNVFDTWENFVDDVDEACSTFWNDIMG